MFKDAESGREYLEVEFDRVANSRIDVAMDDLTIIEAMGAR